MKRDDDGKPRPPWWSEHADEDAPLPDGFPERPDLRKVDAMRAKLRASQASGKDPYRTPLHDRLAREGGRSARDIGSYTLIPMMMIAGPLIGWLMGRYVEGRLGGEPWPGVVGIFLGLIAAVRQIVLMLKKRAEEDRDRGPGGP